MDIATCDCSAPSEANDGTSCVIYELNVDDSPIIQLTRQTLSTPYIDIEDSYLILAQETIEYNTTTEKWTLETDNILFACDWDLCNRLEYVAQLPKSFQFNINETWLTENIYGSGMVDSCYVCDSQVCGNSSFPIDQTLCTMSNCAGSNSCVAIDLWDNLQTGDQCYQSRCWRDSDGTGSKQRIYVEAVVYLAKNRSEIDIWELDLYCSAPSCTRTTIFKEILDRLQWNLNELDIFPSVRPTTPAPPTTGPPRIPIRCYSCECSGTQSCPCDKFETNIKTESYCVIIRQLDSGFIFMGHLSVNASQISIRDFPYLLIEEAIDYNETTRHWRTFTNFVIYGCDWDECNKPDLIKFMTNSFQLNLPEDWLNLNVLGNDSTIRDCHECPGAAQCGTTDFLDAGRCPIKECHSTCLVLDTFNNPQTGELCYKSYCLPNDTDTYKYPKHRVEIEAVVYAKQPDQVDIWEIDFYCRADDCSRPYLFRELREKLQYEVGTLQELFNETDAPNSGKRRCYDCFCYGQSPCKCNTTSDDDARSSYCVIVIEFTGQSSTIVFEHIRRNSTGVYIREFPYLLIEESIIYNEASGRWLTTTNFAVFGCNIDYCNHPGLLQYIPSGFQMRLPETWLNTTILGTGQPVRDCHSCPEAPQCGTTDFLDASRCPIRECNTTCLVSDTFNDPLAGTFCFQSFCAPPDSPGFEINPHRVEIEGIMYGARPEIVELWEIDLYCRGDNCSEPNLFKDLRSLLTVQTGNLQQLFNLTVIPSEPQRRCYECECYNEPQCTCNTVADSPAISSYCMILIEFVGQTVITRFGHIPRNSTHAYVRDFPYILVEEMIVFSPSTGRWDTRPKFVLYGCNRDYCNSQRFIPYLPNSFQMRLSEAWLNTSVLGSGESVRNCHECPEAPQCGTTDFLDVGRCPIRECNTTCLVSDSFNDPTSDELCYQSYCTPAGDPLFTVDPYRVEIEGILYLNRVQREIEIWEIDVFCRADDCSRPEIFRELRSNLTLQYGDLSIFDTETTPAPITSTQRSSTLSTTATTSSTRPSTTQSSTSTTRTTVTSTSTTASATQASTSTSTAIPISTSTSRSTSTSAATIQQPTINFLSLLMALVSLFYII